VPLPIEVEPVERLRVLWLIKGLGAGGAERLLCLMAEARDRAAFACEAAYLLPWKDALVQDLTRAGVRVTCLDGTKEWDLRWAVRLRLLLRQRRIDVLHVHSPYVAGIARLVARSLPRRRRPRIVYTEHLPWPGYVAPTRWLNAITFPLDDAHVAVSDAVRRSVWSPLARNLTTVVHGIPLDRVRAHAAERERVRSELGVARDEVLIGTVGNLREQKRYPDLLDAAREVLDAEERVTFVAAGAGAEEPPGAAILAHHERLSLADRFRFLGYVEETGPLLAACDVFVLASEFEGLAVAMMEALALGLPVVATAVPGIAGEIREEREGLLVPVGRPDRLAEAILSLVRDPARRARMAAAARSGSDRFEITSAVRRVEDLYRDQSRRRTSVPSTSTPRGDHL
jgi:glycosyltransferase involved in cell wall biosynthesis